MRVLEWFIPDGIKDNMNDYFRHCIKQSMISSYHQRYVASYPTVIQSSYRISYSYIAGSTSLHYIYLFDGHLWLRFLRFLTISAHQISIWNQVFHQLLSIFKGKGQVDSNTSPLICPLAAEINISYDTGYQMICSK